MRRRRNSISFLALASMASSCAALTAPQPIALPQLDFDRLGDVILAGNFLGISLLDYAGRETMLETPTAQDDLILQTSNDTYVSSELADGSIHASCLLGDNHTAIIAGNFTKVLNVTAPGLARLDLSNMTASSLGSQAPQGSINSLWCNNTQVYAGGTFEFDGSHGVAVWNSLNNTWSSPNFKGFVEGSSVNAIIPYGDNVVFGGTMKGLVPSKNGNATSRNSSELLNPGMQPVSFNFANATGFGSQGSSGESAPQLLCPYTAEAGSTGWTADLDSTTGSVNVTLGAGTVLPTRMRLFNLPDGSGTKTFRLVTEPANGIMNLSYTNASGEVQTCSAYCPLPESNSTEEYRDFELVNVVPTNSLRIELLDYYGSVAGLKGIQLFQEGQYAYANEEFNMPRTCGSSGVGSDVQGSQTATATLHGSWSSVSDYMAANITDKASFGSTFAKLSPTFNDYTVDRGQYAVQLWTPGCERDNVCSQRGQVNVSVYPGFGSPQSTVLYQTNNDAKYDLVYNGTLQDGAYIQISPTSQNQLPMQLVAYKANLIYVGSPKGMNASRLFEYSPANFSSNSSTPVGRTPINMLGEQLGRNASVNALLLNGTSSLLVGGAGFASNLSTSLLSLPLSGSANDTRSVGGLNSTQGVFKLYEMNGTVFALSSQTYSVSGNLSASSLGIGAASNAAAFNFDGTNYVAFSHDEGSAAALSLWEPEQGRAPRNISERVHGHLAATFDLGNATAYVGNLEIVDAVSLGGGARLSAENSVEPQDLPFSFASPSSEAQSRVARLEKRVDLSNSDLVSGNTTMNAVYTGVFINSTHSVVAGHFNATVSKNESATNALLLANKEAQPLPLASGDSIDAASSFYASAVQNETVALGGSVSGKINGSSVKGLLLYNSSAQDPFANQAPALSADMLVSTLAFKPNTSALLVGGRFSNTAKTANSSCDGMCVYDVLERKWYSPASFDLGAQATVNDIVFETGDRLVIGGNFTAGSRGQTSQVAIYDFSNNTLEPLNQLPGPVTSLVVLSNATQDPVYAVAGARTANGRTSPYLNWYNGTSQSWEEFDGVRLHDNSTIAGLSVVTLRNSTGAHGPLNGNQGLLVSGQLSLQDNTQASVAIYDGTKLQGLYATTASASDDGSSAGSEGAALVNAIYSQYAGNLKGGVVFNEGTSAPHPKGSPRPGPSTAPHPTSGSSKEGHVMPAGHVVGIACGIGIGCVMVLTLIYLLVEFLFSMASSRIPYQNLAQKPASDPMAGTKVL